MLRRPPPSTGAPDDVDPELAAMAAEAAGGLRFVPGRMEWLRLEEIEPHPRNPKEGDAGALADVVDVVGFVGLVLVQDAKFSESGRFRLIDGHTRYADLQRRGAAAIPCWIVDVDDDTALRILVGWDRLPRLARNRPDALAEILKDLAGTDRGMDGSAWDGDDLDEILRELDPPKPRPPDSPPNPGAVAIHFDSKVSCPSCGHQFEPGGRP